MYKIFTTIFLCATVFVVNAQTIPEAQPYGKVDVADLDMKTCDFEKDANAMVLFDKASLLFDGQLDIVVSHHKRIKIFNDNGKNEADIHIPFKGGNRLEYVTGVQAQTINLVNGKVEITKLDKSLIYNKIIDKVGYEIVFTFPNVKPGSIIEYKYTWSTVSIGNFPDWYFQEKIPVRYSEYTTMIPDVFNYRTQPRVHSPFVKNTSTSESRTNYGVDIKTRAMANIHSLPNEAYMSSYSDNLECLLFQLISVSSMGFTKSYSDTWAKVGGILIDDEDFGGQLKRKLKGEELIVNKAKALKTDEEKIAYVFNEVKNTMKWNGVDRWYTNDGTAKAWEAKTGNSAEINIILYHLLRQAGVEAYPMVVSTREHGKVIPFYTSLIQFNRTVAYIPISKDKMYVLDATGKYNVYNEIPPELLNSSGLFVDKPQNIYDIVYLHKEIPVRQSVYVTADIKPDGKIEGVANITSSSYNRIRTIEKYKTDGEKKYIDYLRDDDNNLKVSAIKFDNMDVDTLPLIQNINFSQDLAGSDETYIYLNPNVFASLKTNPFLSENRMTDIDFSFCKSYVVGGLYKIPAGYKVDAMPKNGGITMADKSVVFRRTVAEQDGSIVVRYTVEYKKQIYTKETYPDFHEFIKKMYEMLNEQIILKKA